MTFKLHTSDIQKLTIALIESEMEGTGAITEDDYKRYDDILLQLNNLCCEDNGYTLTIDVKS